jgi:hypothetical protein
MSRLLHIGPLCHKYVGVCGHIGVDDRENLETYSNSVAKNTSETDIFPHGPKSLLTSIMGVFVGFSCIFLLGILIFKGLTVRCL